MANGSSAPIHPSRFDLRISDFFRASDFGLRISLPTPPELRHESQNLRQAGLRSTEARGPSAMWTGGGSAPAMRRRPVAEETRSGNHADEDQKIALEVFACQEGDKPDETCEDKAREQPAERAQNDADDYWNDPGANLGGAALGRCDHQSAEPRERIKPPARKGTQRKHGAEGSHSPSKGKPLYPARKEFRPGATYLRESKSPRSLWRDECGACSVPLRHGLPRFAGGGSERAAKTLGYERSSHQNRGGVEETPHGRTVPCHP